MLKFSIVFSIVLLFSVGVACKSERHSSVGFRVPADGSAERGRQAFVELRCNSCHKVAGVDLPGPAVQPSAPVVLGGEVDEKLSDAYLVAVMIHASEQHTAGSGRMPNFADKITVRQMVDVIAFLQSRYKVKPALPNTLD
jgi:mono/diheme cytochrome c family protein